MFSSQIKQAYLMADIVRKVLPQTQIIIGGPHVTVYPEEALKRLSIDYVVRGEGEIRMTQLMIALSCGMVPSIEGVHGKNDLNKSITDKKISFITDLDSLPLPAYDLVNLQSYFDLSKKGFSPRYREWGDRALTLITSRGCPHNCCFCSIHSTMGYQYRYHSPEYVENHLNHLVKEYGVDFIHFEDDNFIHLPERFDAIIRILRSKKHIKGWDTPNGIRGDAWTFKRVCEAKESGCQFLSVAVESAVPRVLNEIVHKKLDLKDIENLIRYCNKVKLRLHAVYIIGFPGETMDEIKATIRYALTVYLKWGVTPFLQPLIPIPNTPIYNKIITDESVKATMDIKYNQISTAHFSSEEIRRLYKTYKWKRIVIFAMRTFLNRNDFVYNVKLLLKYPQAIKHALIEVFKVKV
jgi:radical SAM superfamily enzyme YgiQ (UPF0313 family)